MGTLPGSPDSADYSQDSGGHTTAPSPPVSAVSLAQATSAVAVVARAMADAALAVREACTSAVVRNLVFRLDLEHAAVASSLEAAKVVTGNHVCVHASFCGGALRICLDV